MDTLAQPLRIAIVIVNYNGHIDTLSLLESLNRCGSRPTITVVVDNSDSPVEWEKLNTLLLTPTFLPLKLRLARTPTNLGYFGGCNFGLELVRKEKIAVDWIIYCNNDLTVAADFWLELTKAARTVPDDVLVIAPDVVDRGTERHLNPFLIRRPSRAQLKRLRSIFKFFVIAYLHTLLSQLRSRVAKPIARQPSDLSLKLYACHGSFFLMRNSLVTSPLDSEFFMYAEEITVAERCRALRGTTLYLPTLRLIHSSHAQTGKRLSRRTFNWKKSALTHIYTKYDWN